MTTPKTAQQVNDPQTGQVSTSRHSALSELMIQNAELREQLRVLQCSYDALSQMKEKAVASRIEVDELKEENDSLNAENARLAREVEGYKEMASSQFNTAEKLRSENARLAAERAQCLEDVRGWLMCKVTGENCLTTAGDILDDIRFCAEDPERFQQAVKGQEMKA